jgi:hypothetical protein
MFKSFINPEKIIGNGTKAVSPEAFSNFMSGKESSLGKSVLNSATNNISDFSKKGISVDTSSNIAPLIQNISTSIVNNVDNSISNTLNSFKTEIQTILSGVQQQVQSNLASVIQNFSKDYQQRIQSKEDNKPSNVLKGFLGLYQNAIDFVSFFGDSKNNKKIETSLKSLRSMFDESFNTAIVIRQVINKIVKQLSNLPTASGNAGPLNLDVSVPGGRLKQAGGASIGKFLKGRGGQLLGAGVVGAGALGMMSMQAARASQEEKLAETTKRGVGGEDKPNEFMKGLNSIIERFSDAIDGLLGGKKKPPGGGGGSASGGGGGATPPPGGPPGGSPEITTTGGKGVLDLIASVEAGPEGYDSFNQSAGKTSGKATEKTIGWLAKNAQGAIGRYQHMPEYILNRAKAVGYDENTLFTPEVQDAITIKQLKTEHRLDDFLSGKMSSEDFLTRISPTWRGLPQGAFNARKLGGTSDSTYNDVFAGGGRNAAHMTSSKVLSTLKRIQSKPNTQIEATSPKPTPQTAQKPPAKVTPAPRPISRVEPAPKTQVQKVSQAITSPGQPSNTPQVINVPTEVAVVPMGGNQSGGGGVAPLSPPSGDRSDVSMYGSTGNPNNPNPYTSLILGMSFA